MNYRVRRQFEDQREHFGKRVIARGHVLADPPFPNLNAMIESGFLSAVDDPPTLFLVDGDIDEPEEILADLEPYIEIETPTEQVDGGDSETSVAADEFDCRHGGCDKGPWETRRARTCHEVAVHGSPGEGE